MPCTPNMPCRVSITSALDPERSTAPSAVVSSASVSSLATSAGAPVADSDFVPASGADSPSGTAPLIGALASDSLCGPSRLAGNRRRGPVPLGFVTHRSRPFSSWAAGASSWRASAASSAAIAFRPTGGGRPCPAA